jgi:hypothetical protein
VLDRANDPAQLRCCLIDAVEKYAREARAGGATNFLPLWMFIRFSRWRPEYLEFNLAAAA